ncbi:MAG: DUF1489 domain-containing protein [Hyphomicrobiaceae bacterium]
MALHMIKLCVGAHSIEDLADWQRGRIAAAKKAGKRPLPYHTTFQSPKRQEDLLDGGSLYWVMKGIITARQRFVAFDEGTKEDGTPCCVMVLDPELIAVRPVPRRAFQGWRYLSAEDAPEDLGKCAGNGISAMPPGMRKALAELCLI